MLDLETTYSRNKDCPMREIGDGVVILAPSGETTHSLENLAAFIWRQLDGQNNLSTILAAILEEYDIDEDTAQADLLKFAQQLLEAGLIIKNVS